LLGRLLGNSPKEEQDVNIFTGAGEREMLKRDTTAHNFANQLLNLYLESRATPGISASNNINGVCYLYINYLVMDKC
jgi:hypothetical protein